MAGLYVHVPFCLSKCIYCSFNSEGGHSGVPRTYIDALKKDAAREARFWEGHSFRSIYIGGGTPSLLLPADLKELIYFLRQNYSLTRDAEITIEANPATVDRKCLDRYVEIGITRISIGVQSLIPEELRFLRRRHTPVEALALLKWASEIPCLSTSADIIIGIPGQVRDTLAWTLDKTLRFVDHLSCYMLSVDPLTRLHLDVKEGRVSLPSDEIFISLYHLVDRRLEAAGMEHYEISNWCRPGHECIHNLNYWLGGEYLGLGAGAHSHIDDRRMMREVNWRHYVELLNSDMTPIVRTEHLTEEQKALEKLMLSLRTSAGLGMSDIAKTCADDVWEVMENLVSSGYLVRKDENVSLSPKGILLETEIVETLASRITLGQLLLR